MKNYKLENLITTLSPLSHISESISTNSYLVQDPILQPDGKLAEVFCYSGNAFRGQLRDLLAKHYADYMGVKFSMDTFHLLFSGGKISGGQSINLEEARAYRRIFPLISIFGGGIGNQIVQGKAKVSNAYPICIEAMPILGDRYKEMAKTSYRLMTQEKSFTRMDDSKKVDNFDVMGIDMLQDLVSGKKKDEVSTQMRMESELLISGVNLVNDAYLVSAEKYELGALVLGLKLLSDMPYIGGQSNKGHGKIKFTTTLIDASGEDHEVIDSTGALTEFGERRVAEYLEHLDVVKSELLADPKIAKDMGLEFLEP